MRTLWQATGGLSIGHRRRREWTQLFSNPERKKNSNVAVWTWTWEEIIEEPKLNCVFASVPFVTRFFRLATTKCHIKTLSIQENVANGKPREFNLPLLCPSHSAISNVQSDSGFQTTPPLQPSAPWPLPLHYWRRWRARRRRLMYPFPPPFRARQPGAAPGVLPDWDWMSI